MRVSICILSCSTIHKYAEQMRTVEATWAQDCKRRGVRYYYFCGEDRSDIISLPEMVLLDGVHNDYLSASFKQWHGLEYVIREDDPDFTCIATTDTFIHVDNLLKLLDTLSPDTKLYIGGHGDIRHVGGRDLYFHSGGGSIVLSRAALHALEPYLRTAHDEWVRELGGASAYPHLTTACDVAIAMFAERLGCEVVTREFYHCNHKGIPCHTGQVDLHTSIGLHLMSKDDMHEAYNEVIQRRLSENQALC